MKSRLILNLLLIMVVCVLGWLALRPSPKQSDEGTLKISTLSAAQINKIAVQKPGHDELRLEKQGEYWKLAQGGRADRYQVERLLNIAGATAKSKIASTDLKEFSLDPALATVTLNDQVFRFGATNDVTYEQYVATADGIFLASPQFGSSLPDQVSQLLSRSLLNDGEMPSGFEFAELKLSKDKASGKWTAVGSKAPAADTSQDEFNKFADGWRFATALSAAPWKGGKEKSRWIVRLPDGGGVQFALAATEPELVLVRLDEKIEFHFQRDMAKKLSEIPPPAKTTELPGATSAATPK
jgi:Domain of unknown function (DUF4340)